MRLILYILIPVVILILSIFVLQYMLVPKYEQGIFEYDCELEGIHIEDDIVYLGCWLNVKNHSEDEVSFTVNAQLEDETEAGLLKEPYVYLTDEILNEKIITLKSQENTRFYATFVGKFGGTMPENHRVKLISLHFEIIQN